VRSWLRRASFQTRLSALVAIAVGLTVALAAIGAYLAVSHQLYGSVNNQLRDELAEATQSSPVLDRQDAQGIAKVFNSGAHVALWDRNGQQLQIPGDFGQIQLSSPPLQPTPSQLALTNTPGAVSTTDTTVNGQHFRVVARSLEALVTGPGGITSSTVALLLIGQPLDSTMRALAHLRLALALIAVFGVGIAVCLGMAIAQATISPVKKLTAAAEHVAETQDLRAVIDDEGDDELGRLASAFNKMLTALAASRQQQAQLVSDAGHELRTPLTSLRTNIEFLLRARTMPDADREALLHDVEDQLEELTALVGDIVDTARQDERPERDVTEVRLGGVIDAAAERARRRAPSLRFDVAVDPGSVRAQPALLERALLNVLDNAAKWSPPAGTVTVRARRGVEWTITVDDQGPGISPEDLPKIFDRFYRAPSARSMPGSGLGLAIVHKAVTDHGGTVTVGPAPAGGTRVEIRLPIVEEEEPTDDAGPWGPTPPAAAVPPPPPPGSPAPTLPEPAPESAAVPAHPGGAGD
jgi:two-component system sensor histidine kinase MprB